MTRLWRRSSLASTPNVDVRRRRRRLTWPVALTVTAVAMLVTCRGSGQGVLASSSADGNINHSRNSHGHERNHQLRHRLRRRYLDREGSTLANGGMTKSSAAPLTLWWCGATFEEASIDCSRRCQHNEDCRKGQACQSGVTSCGSNGDGVEGHANDHFVDHDWDMGLTFEDEEGEEDNVEGDAGDNMAEMTMALQDEEFLGSDSLVDSTLDSSNGGEVGMMWCGTSYSDAQVAHCSGDSGRHCASDYNNCPAGLTCYSVHDSCEDGDIITSEELEEDDGMEFKDGTTMDLVSNPDYAAIDNASDPYWDIIKPHGVVIDTDTNADSMATQTEVTTSESSSEEYNNPLDDVQPSSLSSETPEEEDESYEVRDSSGEMAPASSAPLNPVCNPKQHALIFTINTDMYSMSDNSWAVTHASFGDGQEVGNSGLYIASESVGAGQLGYGAVVPHNMCADVANGASGHGDPNKSMVIDSTIVESCYDVEVYDANGDGLTQFWGPGGFSLTLDGTVVLEHRATTCDEDDVECAKKEGFDYCGARVCTVKYGGVVSAYATLDSPKMSPDTVTLNTLSGSQCKLHQPLCQSSSDTPTNQVPLTVQVKTDSYADEVSWEVRVSKKNDPKKMDMTNGLLLAGGSPVFGASSTTSSPLIGQLGVGAPLEDNEEYTSTACVSMKDQCYDFRAYDAYGDGLGCGADGSITISLGEEIKLVQKDKDMAKRQKVYDGAKEKTVTEEACMDKTRLSKWSLCAVRICVDGTIIGLEGNQCAFGKGDELLDLSYNGTDPLNTMTALLEEMDESESPTFMPTTYMPTKKITEAPTLSSTVLITNMQTLSDFDINIDDDPPTPSPSLTLRDFNINIDDDPTPRPTHTQEEEEPIIEPREQQLDTWAEYYDALDPGFRDDPETKSDNNIPLPMWAKLDLREQDEEEEQMMTFDTELDDQDNDVVEKKKNKKPKDKKGHEPSTINDDDNDDETEDRRQSFKKPKIKRKKNKDKKSDENEEENVMGYVPNQESIAEMQKNYDIVGDNNNIIYVWMDDDEAQTTKSKKRRDEEDKGRHLLVDSSVETRDLQSARLSLWWCGVTYNDAVESCGKRCTFGYGCPDGELCFSVSELQGERCDDKKSKTKVRDFDIDVDDDDDDDAKSKRKDKMKQRTESLKKDSDDKSKNQRKKNSKQKDKDKPRENVMGFDSDGKGVHDSNDDDRDEKKRSKVKNDDDDSKKQKKMGKVDSKMSDDEGHKLNVMGYVSGNVSKSNERDSDSEEEKGYEIINGNIHAEVNPVGNRKGRHMRMLRDADDR